MTDTKMKIAYATINDKPYISRDDLVMLFLKVKTELDQTSINIDQLIVQLLSVGKD